MNSTLQELTNKIYSEGVEKGKSEAEAILAEAIRKADEILAKAQDDALKMKENAEKETIIIRQNVESEIKLFADQAINALKSTIVDMVCGQVTVETVKSATSDKDFMQSIILKIADAWIVKGSVTIQTADEQMLTEYFRSHAKDVLDKGLKIEEVKGLKTSFAIFPDNNTYKITIGEEEFVEYFKEFLRPKLKDLLF